MLSRTLITVLLVSVMAVPGFAAASAEDAATPDLSDMSGKDIYRNVCKVCHEADSEAGEYTPMTLIQDQWTEFFDGILVETHQDLTCPKDENRKLLDVLDKSALKKVREFCVDHAADSEQPMTCG
jgi:hypothetical protein